ncbi:MAG: hypothetical protein ACLFUH_07475 [Bacteroidales bacterium]
MNKRKGLTIGDIGPIASTLGVAIIIISVIAMILASMAPQTYVATEVTNESHSLTLPGNLTVDNVEKGIESDSETLYFWDDSESTATELDETDNYTVTSYDDGKFEVKDISDYSETDGDTINIDYAYLSAGTATSVLTAGEGALEVFADWFSIIVIVSVATIILGLVYMFRRQSGGQA